MKKSIKFFNILLLVIWDVFSVLLSVIIGLRLRYGFLTTLPLDSIELGKYTVFCISIALIMNILLFNYSHTFSYFGLLDIFRQVVAIIFTGFCIYSFGILFPFVSFSQKVSFEAIIIISLIMMTLMIIGRSIGRITRSLMGYFSTYLSSRKNKRRILIYGAGEAGAFLVKKMMLEMDSSSMAVALIDDNPLLWGKVIGNIKIIGGRDILSKSIQDYDIDEVIIAIPRATNDLIRQVMTICIRENCMVRRFGSLDDVKETSLDRIKISDINLDELLRRDSVTLDMKAVSSFISDKVVLVTGGAGSIGSELCRQVLKFGAKKLIIFDINENGLFYLDNELKLTFDPSRYILSLGSIRDIKRLDSLFDQYKPDIVFHAAAHKHVPMTEWNPREAIKNNVFGTLNVAQTAIKHNTKKFILISTDKAVNPTNIMGASKRISEMMIQLLNASGSDTQFAAVRFGNVLGSEGSVVPFFQKQIEAGGPVTVTHPEMKRYFMTIPEAVQLVLEAAAMAKGEEIFVLDMGEPVLITDLAKDLIRLNGLTPYRDIDIVFSGLRPGEKLFEEIRLADEDTCKTKNNKIYINKPIEMNRQEFYDKLVSLENSIQSPHNEMFESVRDLVPTFHHIRFEHHV